MAESIVESERQRVHMDLHSEINVLELWVTWLACFILVFSICFEMPTHPDNIDNIVTT